MIANETDFRVTVECAASGIAQVSPEGHWLWVNDRLCEIAGYSRDELLARTFQEITHPDDLAADLDMASRMLAGEIERFAMDKRYIRKDGTVVWVRLTVSLVRNEANTPLYFIVVAQDIADQKRLEEALRRALEEHSHLLGMVAHELNTPLTSLKARAQLLSRALENALPGRAPHLPEMQRAIARMERQVSDLRATALVEQGTLEMQIERCDVRALCRQQVEEQRLTSERVITSDLPEGPVLVEADAARVGQVLSNLLTNALKYSPMDRPIVVSLRPEGKYAVVAVRDEGPGIPPEALPRLFERYYRVPGIEARNGTGGLGLGLYISQQLIERQGGTLSVTSNPGQGTTFTFTLPLAI